MSDAFAMGYVLGVLQAVVNREEVSYDQGEFLSKKGLAVWDQLQSRWVLTPRGRVFSCKVLQPKTVARIYSDMAGVS